MVLGLMGLQQHISSGLKVFLVIVITGWMVGCATLSANRVTREWSFAYQYADTSLAKAYRRQVTAHAGKSGFLLLGSGMDAFAARTALFSKAERTIDVQYYSVVEDMAGLLFLRSLLAAADRGVRVRILLDDVHGHKLDDRLTALERHQQIEVRFFNPLNRSVPRVLQYIFEFGKYSRRMHNKSVVVDNALAIIGSRNIGNEYAGVSPSKTNIIFSGLDVLAVGPVVGKVSDAFDLFWNSRKSIRVSNLSEPSSMGLHQALKNSNHLDLQRQYESFLATSPLIDDIADNRLEFIWGQTRLIADSPQKIEQRMARQGYLNNLPLQRDVANTRRDMWIVSPYVVPGGDDGMDFFRDLRRRGIDVSIVTNSYASTDNKLVNAHFVRYRRDLLEMGVRIFEFKAYGNGASCCHKVRRVFSSDYRSGLHSKIIAYDHTNTYVGSMNMDPRSIYENTELGVVVDSPKLSRNITSWFDLNLKGVAYELSLAEDGSLVWQDMESGERQRTEPNTHLFGRMVQKFLGWLPVEKWL